MTKIHRHIDKDDTDKTADANLKAVSNLNDKEPIVVDYGIEEVIFDSVKEYKEDLESFRRTNK